MRLSAPVSLQGGLLLVELRSRVPLNDVKGEWGDKRVPFWVESAALAGKVESPLESRAARAGKAVRPLDIERALVGVDLEKPPGKYDWKVTASRQDAEPFTCRAAVTVRAGRFAVERLQVEPKFVEPSKEDLERAEKEGQRLREIFRTVTPEKLWQGPFRLPLDNSPKASNFGRRRVLNGEPRSPHSGADFPAPAGTPVYAPQGGRVVLAEPLYFSGNTVVIDHGLGVYTFYGHFSEIGVAAGDTVQPGDLIGKVGATGRVTGPHLHWGLTVEGARVNPLAILTVLPK